MRAWFILTSGGDHRVSAASFLSTLYALLTPSSHIVNGEYGTPVVRSRQSASQRTQLALGPGWLDGFHAPPVVVSHCLGASSGLTRTSALAGDVRLGEKVVKSS
jgi:hypothetical protein